MASRAVTPYSYLNLMQVLSDSATALMPQVMEKAHQWAQYWR